MKKIRLKKMSRILNKNRIRTKKGADPQQSMLLLHTKK